MVNVHSVNCSFHSCWKRPTFNIEGKGAAYCKQHAHNGMVNVRGKRCSNDSCTKRPCFNVEGSKMAVYCRKHAEDGMVNIECRRCAHAFCTKQPTYDFTGIKTARYCKQHAADGMLNVTSKRCEHNSCLKPPAWGSLTDGVATTCRRHRGDILGGPVINFKTSCEVEGCKRQSRWGLDGEQPTHCHSHGPLKGGLVCTVAKTRSKKNCRKSFYGAVEGPLFHVKTECLF